MVEFCLLLTGLSAHNTSVFYFQDSNLSKSQYLMCALVLYRSAVGLLIGKFGQFLTELSAHDTIIMAGYYSFMFYLF